MKVIVFFSCLIVLSAASHNAPKISLKLQGRDAGDVIENILNALIALLKPYDPIDVVNWSIDFLEHRAEFKGSHADGHSNIIPNASLEVGIFLSEFSLNISIPKVSASFESWESNYPVLFGKGTAGIDINNFEISMGLAYKLVGGFTPSRFVTKIENATAYLTGFQNNEQLSQTIADGVNYFLNTVLNNEEFHEMIGDIIDQIIHSILGRILEKH